MPRETTDILVVDDNELLLGVITEVFKECGYTVRTATDGFAALLQIRRKVPHVLTVNWQSLYPDRRFGTIRVYNNIQ